MDSFERIKRTEKFLEVEKSAWQPIETKFSALFTRAQYVQLKIEESNRSNDVLEPRLTTGERNKPGTYHP